MQITKLLIFILIVVPVQAYAENGDLVARVVFKRGEVTASSNKNIPARKLKRNDPIYSKDTVIVGKRGLLQLVFVDKTLLYLKSGSKVHISEYEYNNRNNKGQSLIELLKGNMRSITGVIGKKRPEKIKYKNKVATIGIRGTAIELRETSVTFDFGLGYMETNSGLIELSEGESAKQTQEKEQPVKYFLLRDNTDPAVISRVIVESKRSQIPGAIANLCGELPLPDAIFLLGIESEVPGSSTENIMATVRGLKNCFNSEQLLIILTATASLYPDMAPQLLDEMLSGNNPLNVNDAFKAVLKGLMNPTQDLLNEVIVIAVSKGDFNEKSARKILLDMQSQGYCVL